MKISDMIVSALLKKGILYEARLVDVECTIPRGQPVEIGSSKLEDVTIRFKADYMSIQIEKDKGDTGA